MHEKFSYVKEKELKPKSRSREISQKGSKCSTVFFFIIIFIERINIEETILLRRLLKKKVEIEKVAKLIAHSSERIVVSKINQII